MKEPVLSNSMSAADAAFLYLERKEIPLHIASVAIFESAIPFKEFVGIVRSKLHLVPRYRQIAVASPSGLDYPTWQDYPNFDIHQHIFRVSLEPPGGEAELEALAGRILSGLLDRNKPLWDMHIVDGLEGGRGAIIWRIHHALADGVSGTELMKVILDATPEGSRAMHRERIRRAHPKKAVGLLGDEFTNTVQNTLGGLIAFEQGLLEFADALLNDKKRSDLQGVLKLLPELAASVERLPFNKPCGGDRKFCWTELDLAEVQAVREAVGGTVNDVVLAVLTRALAHYVKLHGQTVANRFVRIVCPVSLRRGDQNESLGNQISFLPVALPLDVRNPVRRLQGVTSRMEIMKHSSIANLVGLAGSWIAAAPPPLQALLWRGIPDVILPVPLLNMICTNIPGSPVPLYAAGKRMIAAYPQVPTGYDLGVGCAVQSYDGKLCFGLIAESHVAADVGQLRDFLFLSFRELYEAAVLKKAQSRVSATRRAQPQPTELATQVSTTAPEPAKETVLVTTPAEVDAQARDAA